MPGTREFKDKKRMDETRQRLVAELAQFGVPTSGRGWFNLCRGNWDSPGRYRLPHLWSRLYRGML